MIAYIVLSVIALAAICLAVIFYTRWRRTEHWLHLADRTIEQHEELLSDLYKVQARYVVTESDEFAYSDINKRNKAIRKTLIYQISQEISKLFKNAPDVELSDSGREIHSYKFLIKRI